MDPSAIRDKELEIGLLASEIETQAKQGKRFASEHLDELVKMAIEEAASDGKTIDVQQPASPAQPIEVHRIHGAHSGAELLSVAR